MARTNGLLLWKDGRKQETSQAGGERCIVPTRHDDGRWTETTFHAEHVVEPDVIAYVEGETVDTTEAMREAARRIEDRHWEVVRKGLSYDDDMAAKDAEIARLRAERT